MASMVHAQSAITIEQLNAAVPGRASATSCRNATSECATNSQALEAINHALLKYRISRRSEVVAVLALEAFESASWLYNINHFPDPGRPGQGTRSMLMYNFIEEYAKYLYADKAHALLESSGSSPLVLGDDDSFGSGFWFLAHEASSYYNNPDKLRDGQWQDFKDYIVNGVGASWDDARNVTWNAVNDAVLSLIEVEPISAAADALGPPRWIGASWSATACIAAAALLPSFS
ncbi:hypothetical protein DL89DRAFT_291139 [Linderina pennispora]|uniref:Uncharacterized protein n=1 Tax=Linderina pennispora TaxID=61395 RepID=A0A1Y1WEA2_9FUNG|nr:uncharacterized protein DL89DRAFT_291139 [Linderina pennispora]ORX71851.1 hypothetical protein DL89DRAFT_291139 [Linderina pennispora]